MTRLCMISIVDDDQGVRTSLSSLVRSLGYEVRTYASGCEFLEQDGADESDCLVTDLQMPRMSGEELQTKLKDARRHLPIIVMTAFPSEASRTRVLAAGAFAYLTKPVDVATMADCIARAVRDSPVAAQRPSPDRA